MVFLNAVRLLLENFKHTYKMLIYKFVVTLVAFALSSAILLPELRVVIDSAETANLLEAGKQFLASVFAFDSARLTASQEVLLEAFRTFGTLLSQHFGDLLLAMIGCVLVYLVKRFADTLCHYTVGTMLNNKMATYGETPFMTAMFAQLGKASIYSVVYILVAFLIDVLTFVLIFGVLAVIESVLLELFIATTVIVLMQALKLTGTGLWMPAMTADGKTLRGALHVGTKAERKQRVKMFTSYVGAVYVVIILNVVAALCTFGSALLLTIPASYYLFICLQYVYYYSVQGRNYFISFDRIAVNPDYGDREHIFNYIDETQLPVLLETADKEQEETNQH